MLTRAKIKIAAAGLALAAAPFFAQDALAADGASGAAAPGRSLSPPSGALIAPGPAPAVALLATGDVIGYIDPCG